MKVRFEALLARLGCPEVSGVDMPHNCPSCHHDPPSMRISYTEHNTYFSCPNCGLNTDPVGIAALCLKISSDEASKLFEPSGLLSDTITPTNTKYTIQDYTKDTNSQAIMTKLHATARERLSTTECGDARHDLESFGIVNTVPANTGCLVGNTLQRLIKSGLLSRLDTNVVIRRRSEYITHFTHYNGTISGLVIREVGKKENYSRIVVSNGPELDSAAVYSAYPDKCTDAGIVYVLSSPEEVARFFTRRSVYTNKPAAVIASTGFPLPSDYVKPAELVFVTDGSPEFTKQILDSADLELITCSGANPKLRVFDCKGSYEVKKEYSMRRDSVPIDSWIASLLLGTYEKYGLSEVEKIVDASPGLRRISDRIARYIPVDSDFDSLRVAFDDTRLDETDFVDIPAGGRAYRTWCSTMSSPGGGSEPPGLIANFRIDVIKRIADEKSNGVPKSYQINATFRSGNRYEMYVPASVMDSGRKLINFVTSRVSSSDRPVTYTNNKTYSPYVIVGAFDRDVGVTYAPRYVGLRENWVELPNIRINIDDYTVDSQIENSAIAKSPCLQGPSYYRYRESLASFTKLWKSDDPVHMSLALALSHAAFCLVQDVICKKQHAFHVPARMTMVTTKDKVTKHTARALCQILNGGPAAYITTRQRNVSISKYRSLPVVVYVPDGVVYDYDPESAPPAIVVANPASAMQASALEHPVYIRTPSNVVRSKQIKNSMVEHLRATFPYFLTRAIDQLSDYSGSFIAAQRTPVLFMYKLLCNMLGVDQQGVEEYVSLDYNESGCGPVDLFFSAVHNLCFGDKSIVKVVTGDPSLGLTGGYDDASAPLVVTMPGYVLVSKSLFGHIARFGKETFSYAPDREVLTASLAVSEYSYAIDCDNFWSISETAWRTRVAFHPAAHNHELKVIA